MNMTLGQLAKPIALDIKRETVGTNLDTSSAQRQKTTASLVDSYSPPKSANTGSKENVLNLEVETSPVLRIRSKGKEIKVYEGPTKEDYANHKPGYNPQPRTEKGFMALNDWANSLPPIAHDRRLKDSTTGKDLGWKSATDRSMWILVSTKMLEDEVFSKGGHLKINNGIISAHDKNGKQIEVSKKLQTNFDKIECAAAGPNDYF